MRSFVVAAVSVFAAATPTSFVRGMAPALDVMKTGILSPSLRDKRAVMLTKACVEANSAFTSFTIPFPATSRDRVEAAGDEVLVFDLQVNPTTDPRSFDVDLNGRNFQGKGLLPDWELLMLSSETKGVQVNTAAGTVHSVDVTGTAALVEIPGPNDEYEQRIQFQISSIDGSLVENITFAAYIQPTASQPLRNLVVGLAVEAAGTIDPDMGRLSMDEAVDSSSTTAKFVLADELESLSLLEAKAEDLRTQIAAKQQLISQHLRSHRDHVSIQQLLEECDGLICAARVIAQRICDKVGVDATWAPGYASVDSSSPQHAMDCHDDKADNVTKSTVQVHEDFISPDNGIAQGLHAPAFLTKNGPSSSVTLEDLVNPPNPLVRALGIIVSVLGVAALCGYLRRKCMSMRRRVDRLADREERRNARAYRKAARRVAMRQRWGYFCKAINCFGSVSEARTEDYEEKRALILQDAFLEQLDDLENAEKGEVMEAEIRELRNARDIVASLVRTGRPIPIRDPPPSMVPLPPRRRSSIQTLPSYTSDSLPAYSSRPSTLVGSGASVVSTSDTDSLVTPPSSIGQTGTKYTPTSSIVETSPRPSQDTLRTRFSKDS